MQLKTSFVACDLCLVAGLDRKTAHAMEGGISDGRGLIRSSGLDESRLRLRMKAARWEIRVAAIRRGLADDWGHCQ